MVAMKTNVKFLALAVVATAFATSCVKEEIAEENIKDNQDKTEVEITGQVFEAVMENTKSTLVDKTPTWVEEDVIALFGNGSESAVQLTYAGENKFQTAAGVTVEGPYYAIYPYDENHTVDQTTGIFTATVPAEQTIAQGQNVAAGALASVAYSEDTQLYFRNAVSLIRIENKREDIVSIKIESTNAEQMLAGTFTMDLNPDKEAEGEEPAVTMTEGTAAAITLKPEGETFLAGELYAAVLPTNLDGIKVTFERKGETKNETATVTKTATVELERNGGANLGSFFTYEIKNAQELLAWNKACAKWTAWDVVTLTDNIDCKDVINSENWIPNKFTGTFDGKGKTIDNFVIELAGPAAFFGRAEGAAVIKNLTFGEGCSFTTTAPTTVTTADIYIDNRMYAASTVCEAAGTTKLSNITNKGAVCATTSTASNGNYFGGICAYLDCTTGAVNCKNYGTVTYSSNTTASWVNVGGCFGQTTKTILLEECENYGYILFSGKNSGNKSLNLAGITAGSNTTSFKNCKNLGNIESRATASHGGGTNIGGFVGLNNNAPLGSFENCINGSASDNTLGSLINYSETSGQVCIGGCVGSITSNKTNTSISNFTNYGKIAHLTGTAKNDVSLGGVVGQISDCTSGAITLCENNGLIIYAGPNNDYSMAQVGGVVGYIKNSTYTIGDDTSNGVVNNGEVKSTNKAKHLGAGGIVGRILGKETITTIKNCKNTGSATQSEWLANGAAGWYHGLGGILGAYSTASETANEVTTKYTGTINVLNCTNEGTITKVGGAGTVTGLNVGGVIGGIYSFYGTDGEPDPIETTAIIKNCTNKGTVTNDSGSGTGNGKDCSTGGIIGILWAKGEISDCTNTSTGVVSNKITTNGSTTIKVGGIVGCLKGIETIVNCDNHATVQDLSKSTGGVVGGVIGANLLAAIEKIENCDNSGDVTGTFNSSSAGTIYLGGIMGYNSRAIALNNSATAAKNCHNTGAVTNKRTTTNGVEYVGGWIGFSRWKVLAENCSSSATVKTAYPTTTNYIGAFAGRLQASNSNIKNCQVGGSFNDTQLTADNFTSYCFGTASEYKTTTTMTLK